jgi:hypothetical protein
MLTRKLTPFKEERFLKLREILRSADASFANLEGTVHDWDEGTPGITQGTFMTTEPALLDELKWLGINLVCCANNHAFDYGEDGVLANIKHLDEAGLVHAGSGKNLAEARAPGYLDTPNGRIALVAATAAFRPWNQAGEQRPDLRGRPGINPLGFQTTYSVDAKAFEQLQRISHSLGFEKSNERARKHFYSDKEIASANATELSLLGNRYVLGEGFSIATQANERDLKDNLRWIGEARRQADWVVVSVHCHEFGGPTLLTAASRAELEESADFVAKFAHQAIDAAPISSSVTVRISPWASKSIRTSRFFIAWAIWSFKMKPSASSLPMPTNASISISKPRRRTSLTPAPTAVKRATRVIRPTGKTCSRSVISPTTSSKKFAFTRLTKVSAVLDPNAADPFSPKAKWQAAFSNE